jgi:hypothetical protein
MSNPPNPDPNAIALTVPADAIYPLTRAAQAAYDGVREVRHRAIAAGCSNKESNDLGGTMFALANVLDQLQAAAHRKA